MKCLTIKKITILLLLFLSIMISPCGLAKSNIVNVYTWANYLSDAAIQNFKKETGIEVHVSTYDSNEVLYSKLKANSHLGYDVIVPSSYFVNRMSNEQMLYKLDKSQLANIQYLNPNLLNKSFDPGNQYSVPFIWGTTGIAINTKYWDPKTVQHWSDVWGPRFYNQLLLLDDVREIFAIALIKLGYSINTQNPNEIKEAYELIRGLMRNVKLFNSNATANLYIDEDTTIGMSWSGDAYLAKQENPDIAYIFPKEGFSIWMDCLAIPKNAPHIENALKFINYLMRPSVAHEIMLTQGYPMANLAAVKMLPKNLQKSPLLNPSPKLLKHGQTQLDVGNAVVLYQKYWQLLKLGI